MDICHINCMTESLRKTRLNFLDRLLRRSAEEKTVDFCYAACIKTLNLSSYKRGVKWVHSPVFGINEFLSAMLALSGFIFSVFYFKKYVSQNIEKSLLKNSYIIHHFISNSAYICSFIYHARRNDFTRNADYFTALATCISAAISGIIRIIMIYKKSKLKKLIGKIYKTGIYLYIFCILEITKTDFDYNFYEKACTLAFLVYIIHAVIYIWNYKNEQSAKYIFSFIVLTVSGAIFHSLDTPPHQDYWIDSHALWHLCLFMAVKPQYEYILEDIKLQIN